MDDSTAGVVDALAWPGVFLILALVALFVFHREIKALIGRTKKVGRAGIETFESQPAQPTDEKKGVEEFFRTFDNPLVLEAEQLIQKDLKDRKIDQPSEREKTLIRALASTQIILHFERVYGILWGSQLRFLRHLNQRDQGVEAYEGSSFYEMAKLEFPTWYENLSFDMWLGFLRDSNLVLERDSRLLITVAGREFLKYLIAVGKRDLIYG